MNATDIEKQVLFWRASAEEDLDTGELLIRNIVGRYAENICDVPSSEESIQLVGTVKEVFTWLSQQL